MSEPKEITNNNEAKQHIEELNELGADITEDSVTAKIIRDLGGRISEIADEEGNIKIKKTPDGKLVKVAPDGTQYDRNGNVIPQTPEEEIK